MNKLQLIHLLKNRGVTDLNGITIAEAIRQTGGQPTVEEMVKVNEAIMFDCLNKIRELELLAKQLSDENTNLKSKIEKYEKSHTTLLLLKAAGVDNWEGIADLDIEL